MSTTPNDRTESRLESLRSALGSGSLSPIRRMVHALHPAEIAQLLESLPPNERDVVWELVDSEDDGEVLLHVNDEVRAGLIRAMEEHELLAATENLDIDDLADLVSDLPEQVTRQVLRSMEEDDRERLASVLAYDEDTAGGLMDPDVVTVRPDVTLDVVLRYLRFRGSMPEGTDRLFVVNRYGEYLGIIDIGRLLTNDPQATVAELMSTDLAGIPVDTPASEVAKLFEDRDLVSAAVVDGERRMLGRITIDDVVDVIRDEAEHTVMSMAGLDEEDDMFAPVLRSARRRGIWLGINLLTAVLAAWVVDLYQGTIEQVVALAVLMPIVASMGGIAGSQTLTLMIRGITLGQIHASNARTLVSRELMISTLNALAWAAVVGLFAFMRWDTLGIGAVIAVALVINVVAGTFAGFFIPLILRRMGIDPALAGSVVLTTVTDVIGFLSLLGLGTLFLIGQ